MDMCVFMFICCVVLCIVVQVCIYVLRMVCSCWHICVHVSVRCVCVVFVMCLNVMSA